MVERTACASGRPSSARSIGNVTSCSTSWPARPGASVMTLTLLAVMSGNASKGMVLSAHRPRPEERRGGAEDEDPLADREGDELPDHRIIPPGRNALQRRAQVVGAARHHEHAGGEALHRHAATIERHRPHRMGAEAPGSLLQEDDVAIRHALHGSLGQHRPRRHGAPIGNKTDANIPGRTPGGTRSSATRTSTARRSESTTPPMRTTRATDGVGHGVDRDRDRRARTDEDGRVLRHEAGGPQLALVAQVHQRRAGRDDGAGAHVHGEDGAGPRRANRHVTLR